MGCPDGFEGVRRQMGLGPHPTKEAVMATVKEHADRLGIPTEEIFRIAYARHGLVYGIGGPAETHARYLQAGVIPAYVARHIRDMERLGNYNQVKDGDEQIPLFT